MESAALDVGKAELTCCVRVPDEDRPRPLPAPLSSWTT